MGTRSTTKIYSEFDNEPVLSLYCQYDGYPSGGVGDQLKELCKDKVIVNGYGGSDTYGTHFNTMGCFALWLVTQLKDQIGMWYATSEHDEQAYNYQIKNVNGTPIVFLDGEEL